MAIPGPVKDGAPVGDSPAAPEHSADVHVPDLVGLAVPEAQALVRSLGLRLSFAVWETTVGPWGMVLEQRPAAGRLVRPGRRLYVTVSARPLVRVPEVQGLPQRSAAELLSRLGFVVSASEVGPPTDAASIEAVPAGSVVSCVPRAGMLVAYGRTVTIFVAAVRFPTVAR